MIPVSDAPRSRTFPFVNIALIIASIAVFVYELTLDPLHLDRFVRENGIVSAHLIDWLQYPSGLEEPASVFTAMFIHGGWFHLIGNMLFLWVFGDNVEDAFGHIRYLLFYLLSGIGAVALQVFVDQDAIIPMVGASGAIAGVLGAYAVLYPRATVAVLIPWLWFFGAFPVPAVLLIGIWFFMQLLNGIASLGADAVGVSAGVAFWAHVGGFLTGLVIVASVGRYARRRRRHPVRRRTFED
ncbi:MAG: rhomboid family intramembrane serine protease [Chloroflexi bacterium]|nr:rhomboid family intramembrane serine protease [Chloroflexota bacterium]